MTISTTITTTFDARDLPRWAQQIPAVVDLCRRNLAYRCDVHDARTVQQRRFLTREAERANA